MTKEKLLIAKIKEKNISLPSSSVQQKSPSTPSLPKNARLSLIDEIDPITPQNAVEIEVQNYFKIDSNRSSEALDWWRDNANNFKYFSILAEIYLAIPTSSASSEMSFSTAGNFITSKRSCLNPSKLNKLCVIL